MIAVIKRIRWYLWVLIVLVVAYVGVSIYFMEHFFTGTEAAAFSGKRLHINHYGAGRRHRHPDPGKAWHELL